MTIKDIAKVAMGVAVQLGLRDEQRGTFATQIMRECLFGDSPMEKPTRVVTKQRVASELEGTTLEIKEKRGKRTKQRIEETVRSEATPPQAPSKLLCRAGQKCVCETCERAVYTVINDVYDNMKAVDFAAKFMPIDHGKLMPTDFRLRAIDGCVMTDCPVCDGDMTLVLWGRKPEKDFDEGGVSSVGGV
jgi:hypothetical protein